MARVETVPVNQLPPHMRAWLEEGVVAGVYNNNTGEIPGSMRTLAYSSYALGAAHATSMAMWQPGLLGPRLQELLRIRSAQVNGCNNCAAAIKDEGVSRDDVACMIDMDLSKFTPREAAAMRYLTKFGVDHHSIEDADITALINHFSSAEIVELIYYVATMKGSHQMFSVFQVLSDCEPLIKFHSSLIDQRMAAAVQGEVA